MRIFLIWADSSTEMKSLISALENKGHEIIYWVGLHGGEKYVSNTIFHDHYAAWAGTPANNIDISEFPPPSKDLIEKMYKTESLVLTMMNKAFDIDCVDKRKHLYYNMLQYWDGVIKKFKPDLIIFPSIPHTVYNYIIYDLAKLMDIKTIMFEDTWVSDRLLFYNDWMKGSDELQKAIRKNKDKNFSIFDLSKDLQEYYKLHIGNIEKGVNLEPVYMTHYRNFYSGFKNRIVGKFNFIKNSLKYKISLERAILYLIKQFKPNLKKEYVNIQAKVNFNQKFVYVPLGFQPESVTSPQGDMYVDQILMIETLSASLPKDWIIYVKEHPGQWWLRMRTNYSSSRYQGYYRRISKIKNVKLAPINTNTFKLIEKSQVVSVVTGTPGWQAILRLKPTFIFGYPWYRDYLNLFRINSVASCKEAFEKILMNKFSLNKQDIINYLKSFDEITIHGFLEIVKGRNLEISKQESVNNITKIILNELK